MEKRQNVGTKSAFTPTSILCICNVRFFFFFFWFLFLKNTTYFNTHTQKERGGGFKETDSGVYQKGPNSKIHSTNFKPL